VFGGFNLATSQPFAASTVAQYDDLRKRRVELIFSKARP
jgi:hypothetical protein